MYWSLLNSLETETEKLFTLRSRSFIYIGRGSTGKFTFVFVWRLHVATTLFCSELVYYYIRYILTLLVLRGKTTTWLGLSSSPCAATKERQFWYYLLERAIHCFIRLKARDEENSRHAFGYRSLTMIKVRIYRSITLNTKLLPFAGWSMFPQKRVKHCQSIF